MKTSIIILLCLVLGGCGVNPHFVDFPSKKTHKDHYFDLTQCHGIVDKHKQFFIICPTSFHSVHDVEDFIKDNHIKNYYSVYGD